MTCLAIGTSKWMEQTLGLWHICLDYYPEELLGLHSSTSSEALSEVNVLGATPNYSAYSVV